MKGQVNEMITERQQAILNRIVDAFNAWMTSLAVFLPSTLTLAR